MLNKRPGVSRNFENMRYPDSQTLSKAPLTHLKYFLQKNKRKKKSERFWVKEPVFQKTLPPKKGIPYYLYGGTSYIQKAFRQAGLLN